MIEISRGRLSDFDEIIDFIDFVFSKNSDPHDFPRRYPNLYRRTEESMSHLINLREDGVIKASILAYPRTLSVNGEQLKICGIGSVATHPRFRGHGFMSALLNYNSEEMAREGVHLSNLGGRRARYNHFGYDVGGNCYEAGASYNDISGVLAGSKPEFTFETFESSDTSIIVGLKAIYDSKPLHYIYDRDDFALRFWNMFGSRPYAVRSSSGELAGYICASPRDNRSLSIREIVASSDNDLCDILFSFILHMKLGVHLTITEQQLPYFKPLTSIGSGLSRSANGMWSIMRWPETVGALLRWKASYTELEPGRLVFDIAGKCRFAIEVCGRSVSVCETGENADFELPYFDSIRAFTGPEPSDVFGLSLPLSQKRLITSWLPLPLTWMNSESV